LHLAGPQIALGYLNQPELTATRFVPNPFADGEHDTLYRTGDLVRWLPDGQLQFLGRIDQQVKLRGYRIELAEIEAVMREFAGVRDALVVAQRGDAGTAERLAAYAVTTDPERFLVDELMTFLRQRLPAFMLPSALVALAEFPRTPSGKVDRAALPTADRAAPRRDATGARRTPWKRSWRPSGHGC
jgi:acyl-CoA synthetase (AMP-forming)/AMP-acid ligase II